MSVLALVLAVSLSQQQRPAAQDSFALAGRAITSVAAGVAGVRSALELFQRAVYNDPDGEVVRTSGMLRQRCLALADTTRFAVQAICRSCARPDVQPAFERYRVGLPETARAGERCAATLDRLSRGSVGPRSLRDRFRTVSSPLVAGLARYEARVQRLRLALGRTEASPGRRRSR